jgi:FdhE protein
MADSFLRRWFGGPSVVEPEVAEARAELDRLIAARPAFGAVFRWLHEILPELAVSSDASRVPSLELDQIRARLHSGIPLLRGESLAVDVTAFGRRWQRICGALEAQQPDGAAAALTDAIRHGRLDPAGMVNMVLGGQPGVLPERASDLGLDPSLTATVLAYTLFPEFRAIEASLAPLRDGIDWGRGYCPTCGGWPMLGEFRGLEQARFLRCGLCAAAWEVARLLCPYCGNRNHEQLSSIHGEGEEARFRALVCDGCRGYVKMVSTLSALPPLHLLVTDAATLHLDLAAAERGYVGRGDV